LKSRNDRDRLKRIVQGYRLGERQLDSLQRRLRAERVHIKLKHIVLSLHSYTLPKRTRRSIIGELQNGAPAKPWNLW
jgi:tRNA A37 N6-isopentenylltransferase MiaA